MTQRANYWSGLVAARALSGLSRADLCRRRGIPAGTFAWWKRRLKGTGVGSGAASAATSGPPGRASARFVEVRLPGASSASTYEVVLAGGRSIRVPAQFEPQILSRLITAVEQVSNPL